MLFVVYTLIVSAQTQKETYHLYDYLNIPSNITFDSEGNYVLIDRVCDLCPTYGISDTVSFGRYEKYENKLYFLFSNPSTINSIINADVCESEIELKDSALIVMKSDFSQLDKNDLFTNGTVVVYIISIWYNNSVNIDNLKINKFENPHRYTTIADSLMIPKSSNIPIEKIEIEAVCNIGAETTLKCIYNTKKFSANMFTFYFKDFSYQRFFYRHFYGEPVIIIDNNTIDLKGLLYQKKVKKIKRFPNGKIYYDIFNKVKDPYQKESDE